MNPALLKINVDFINEKIKKIRLDFYFLNNPKKLKIDSRSTNFYYLLRNIPQGYASMNYDFTKNIFENLKTCPFCGLVSYYNNECLYCTCSLDSWEEEQKENYPTIEDYIKEEQLELFATNNKNEKFNDFKISNLAFGQDKNWNPLVSKQQVLQFSKENYWE